MADIGFETLFEGVAVLAVAGASLGSLMINPYLQWYPIRLSVKYTLRILSLGWEFYSTAWYSPMYTLGFPIFYIMYLNENWEISKIDYNQEIKNLGMESF